MNDDEKKGIDLGRWLRRDMFLSFVGVIILFGVVLFLSLFIVSEHDNHVKSEICKSFGYEGYLFKNGFNSCFVTVGFDESSGGAKYKYVLFEDVVIGGVGDE